MAGDACEVRIEETLKIKIAEAKNLPPRTNGTPDHRDTYCVLSLDQEEIFRTATKERTLSPFYGEEFQFEVPRDFTYVSIYVNERDRDRHVKQDKILGKVTIKREMLHQYNKVDNWFPLTAVNANSEVQGKANIEILLEEPFPRITNLSPEHQQDASSKISYLHREHSDGGRSPLSEMTASNSSVDRKVSKSKQITEYCKENIKFGSCSSTSSKKLLSTVTIAENLSGLTRSDSLRSGGHIGNNQILHHTYGPSSSSRNKQISMNAENLRSQQSLNTFIPSDTYVHPSLDSDYSPDSLLDQSPYENYLPRLDTNKKLSVKVLECSDLPLKNGQCDPYAEVTVVYSEDKRVTKRTKVRKKTVNPKFDECFVFDLIAFDSYNNSKDRDSNNTYNVSGCIPAQAVYVTLWHDGPSAVTFLGQVKVSLKTLFDPNQPPLTSNAWYFLRSRKSNSEQQYPCDSTPPGTRLSSMAQSTALGSLRLQLHHTLDRVLPLEKYDRLKALLLRSPIPISSSAIYILGEIVVKADAAQPLVKLLTHEDKLVPMIQALAEAELVKDTNPTTIFRGNTLVSKMMDEAMRLHGTVYLQQTVKPVLDSIMSEKKICEIDPTRVKDHNTIETNLNNLRDYVEKMFSAITKSYVHCPTIMCQLFDVLRQCAVHSFPNNQDVKYSVVSGFIFLRFFAPAILGPRLFDLTNQQIDPQMNRTLTLISKTIQSLGNRSQVCKEEYMSALYTTFTTEEHTQAIKSFLEIISSRTHEKLHSNALETLVTLKEGTMMKKGKRFGRSKFKQRFSQDKFNERLFKLTSRELSYYKSGSKTPACTIPLTEIVRVDPVPDVQNLNEINMFQIRSKDRVLYIQANNCVEKNEWLGVLGKLCEGNTQSSQRKHHPGTFSDSRWSCCLSTNNSAVGCTVEEKGISNLQSSPNLHLHLDPARDLQKIHNLLHTYHMDIDKLLQSTVIQTGTPQSALLASVPEEEMPLFKATLKEMLEVMYLLEEQHRAYQRSVQRKTKYGSKQAPIGDDNYLNLGARPMEMQPYRMLHSATAPSFQMATSPPFSRNFMPCVSPGLPPKFEKVKSLPPAPEKGMVSSHSREFNLQCPKTSLPDKIFTKTDSTYLNNSLYHGSSTESMKTQESNEKTNSRMSSSLSSGYLKMSSFTKSPDEESKVMKDRISPPVPEQKSVSVSEYVEFRPKVPDRDMKPIPNPVIPPKTINKAKAVTPEEQINCPQFSCPEYELMSDFTSNRFKVNECKTEDSPPAIPPRSHQNTPSKIPLKYPPKHLDDVDEMMLQSLERYNSNNGADKCVTTLRIVEDGDDEIDARLGKQEVENAAIRSQNIVDSNTGNVTSAECNILSLSQSNITNVIIGGHSERTQDVTDRVCSIKVVESAASQTTHGAKDEISVDTSQSEETTNKKQKGKDDHAGFFSRKNVQRKSIPKSKKLAVDDVSGHSNPMESSKPALSDRFTPSFFKRKSKVTASTDKVQLAPIY